MNQWRQEALDVINALAGAPPTALETMLLGGGALVAMLVAMRIVGKAVGNDNAHVWSNLAVLLIGGGMMLAAATAVRLYALPHVPWPLAERHLASAAALAVFLLLVIPLQCLIQRSKYLTILIMMAVSLAITALAAALLQQGLKTIRQSDRQTEKIIEHKQTIEDIFRP